MEAWSRLRTRETSMPANHQPPTDFAGTLIAAPAPAARSAAAARGSRWERSTLGQDLHVLERGRELRGPPRLVRLARRVVGQQRIVVDQGVNDLRGGRGHRPGFDGAVIEVVWTPRPDRLRVGV